jgi:hypothetical protein
VKYLIPGLLLGLLFSFIPFGSYTEASSLFLEWHGTTDSIDSIKTSPFADKNGADFLINYSSSLLYINPDGSIRKKN